jgi:hypothetical protein
MAASRAAGWDLPVLVTSGDRGSFPSATVAPDGTVVVAYNVGGGAKVDVGMITLPAGATESDPETILISAEPGAMGRAFVEIDGGDEAWVIPMHEPIGGVADSVWVKRNLGLTSGDWATLQSNATRVPHGRPPRLDRVETLVQDSSS